MNFIKVNQTSLTTCSINKSIGYYQRLNPIILEDDFVSNLIIDKNEDQFIKSYIKYITLARQSALKAFYTIELEYLRYLMNDFIEQYNIIVFYAYRFNTNTRYKTILSKLNSYLYLDDIRQNEQSWLYCYDIEDKLKVNYTITPYLISDELFKDKNYIELFKEIQGQFFKDKINGDIMRFNTFFILSCIKLSNDKDSILIFPFDNLNNILQRLHIEDSFISNSEDFITEINFYTNNSFIKMYECDYKNNKDLYIIDQFNEGS